MVLWPCLNFFVESFRRDETDEASEQKLSEAEEKELQEKLQVILALDEFPGINKASDEMGLGSVPKFGL